MDPNNRLIMFKVILVGELGVGKTSIFTRIKDDTFDKNTQATYTGDFCSRTILVNGVRVTIWDTAGNERYRTLTQSYYRTTHAVYMIYGVDDPSSLYYLSRWTSDIEKFSPSALRYLVGNKDDQENLVSPESIQDFVRAHDCNRAFSVSAATGNGLEELLQETAMELLSLYGIETTTDSFSGNIHLDDDSIEETPPRSCC